MTRNILLRLELLVFLALVSGGCQVVEGIFKAGMWVGILLVVVVLGIVFMLFGRFRHVRSTSRAPGLYFAVTLATAICSMPSPLLFDGSDDLERAGLFESHALLSCW